MYNFAFMNQKYINNWQAMINKRQVGMLLDDVIFRKNP